MSHTNDGACAKCEEIFNKYPGFYQPLKDWFLEKQKQCNFVHISCAGRGKLDQEYCFNTGASKAHYGESSHNANCAIDLFFLVEGKYNLDKDRFEEIMQDLPETLLWFGRDGAPYYELPHLEIVGWFDMFKAGLLKLVQ